MTTNYIRVQGQTYDSPSRLSREMKNHGRYFRENGTTALTTTSEPRLRRGSISSQIMSYLKTRRTPATAKEICEHMGGRREYSSFSSAQRTVGRTLLQLSNWNLIEADIQEVNGRKVTVFFR